RRGRGDGDGGGRGARRRAGPRAAAWAADDLVRSAALSVIAASRAQHDVEDRVVMGCPRFAAYCERRYARSRRARDGGELGTPRRLARGREQTMDGEIELALDETNDAVALGERH